MDRVRALEIVRFTPQQCGTWANHYAKLYSASGFNCALETMKIVFRLSVYQGIRSTNPMKHIKRFKERPKDKTTRLPRLETFTRWITTTRENPRRRPKACADLIEFLACTGLSIGEARNALWKHGDHNQVELLVTGDPIEGTKNRLLRRIPNVTDLACLLTRIEQRSGDQDRKPHVIRVELAQREMDATGERICMKRIIRHDLRHLFGTTCIEAHVDIPTVSNWFSHEDGGAVAMRVYRHLGNEHSHETAQKVSCEIDGYAVLLRVRGGHQLEADGG